MNKSIVREYYETIHVSGDHSKIPRYFAGDHCIRHEPGVLDGVTAFKRDLEEVTKRRSIDEIKFVLGQGDFVFIAAKGLHESEPCLYIDLYRVEDGENRRAVGIPRRTSSS
jgi:predicted SnoaL-like aldol condensation-catalyzing enzyme